MPSTPATMDSLETILFDLDNTLVTYERPPGEVLKSAFDAVGCERLFPVSQYYARYDEFIQQHDSLADARAACFAVLAEEHGYDARLGRTVAAAFDSERDQSRTEFLPGAETVLEALSRTYRIGVVTNGARDTQRTKVESVGLDRWVDTVVVAGDEIPAKPSPEPIRRAVHALDGAVATTVHVGDSPESDVAAAEAAGVESVLISDGGRSPEFEPTHTIDSIDELPSLLSK